MNAIPRTETFIRASATSGWPDCERRAAANLIPDEIKAAGYELRQTEPGIGAAVGTAVHKAASVMLEEKAKTGELPPASVPTDAAIDIVRAGTANGITWDKSTIDINEAEQQVIRMAAVYRRDVAPNVTPVLVEARFEAAIPWSRQPLVVTGQADLLAHEPDDLDDLKTGTKRKNHNPQLGTYSLILRANGFRVKRSKITFIPRVHITSRTKVQAQPGAEITFHDVGTAEVAAVNIIKRIDSALTTFREGDDARGIPPGDAWAFMANPASMLCSPRYCKAFGTSWCREAMNEVSDE